MTRNNDNTNDSIDTHKEGLTSITPKIQATKPIYPQIYAYTLPTLKEKNGWVKIGYTKRQNVETRIKEQTKTAAINLDYRLLWDARAEYNAPNHGLFTDHDFHDYLVRYKGVERQPRSEWFYYNGNPQQSRVDFEDFRNHKRNQARETIDYQLRTEQSAAVAQTLEYSKHQKDGEFLWNAKPRFGKTLTTYDLVRKLDAKMVLVVTNRPAIANSWFDDFEKFIAWQTDFAFVSTSDTLKERPVLTRDEFLAQRGTDNGKKNMIAFISLQDLKGAISFGGNYDKLSWVKKLDWDLLVIDEAHEGVDTLKTDVAFDNISRSFTLHLSGTPFKALASNKFTEQEIFNWTYSDEQHAKLTWNNPDENNPYEKLPKLNLFSYQMSQVITDAVNEGAKIDGDNVDYAFDLNEFFATNDNGTKFIHEADIKKWLDTLTHNEKYPFSTKTLRDELKHTFWLLNRVASAKALKKLLEKHPVFENYKIILAAGDGKSLSEDEFEAEKINEVANEKSLVKVQKAVKEYDKTITLSVGQLTTGITIPEWTAVLMLSNLKSPSQYMQAAFRAQNPWEYEQAGEVRQKKNAYVFDFAPERTLTIYDEFANNLSRKTSNGGGTSEDRKNNIKQLLNFFPVIAEDADGKMIELDATQVLTIPKAIKAQEVVRRGFMSNLLFQNVSGIFASAEVREILEELNPVETGKVTPRQTSSNIDTQDVNVDEEGSVVVDNDIIIGETDAHFGEKVYGAIEAKVTQDITIPDIDIAKEAATSFKEHMQDAAKNFAKERGVTVKVAEQAVARGANIIEQKIDKVAQQTRIKQKEAEIDYKKAIADAQTAQDNAKIAEVTADYEHTKQTIQTEFEDALTTTIATESEEQAQASTQAILQNAENKKKNNVEDDVRARLRGFARTIPSFLMAYGTPHTQLTNFDTTIDNDVFKEVTGITLDQFRTLRDEFNFFDETVFDESVQEFLNKRDALANYFDETQDEDIFDYIPPQETNQIFTPRSVVTLMLDKLEKEQPDIFSDPNKTFADLYVKSGLYLTEIIKRLHKGLENAMPDPDARLRHILNHQVYGFAPSEIIYKIAHRFIYGFKDDSEGGYSAHLVHLDTLPYAKGEKSFTVQLDDLSDQGRNMKFDVVVGNPPYQQLSATNNKQDAVYHYFYDLAETYSESYCLVTPARFLFNAGLTPKIWNKKMLEDPHLKVEYYNSDSNAVFPNTDIKGGVAILYRNSYKNFTPIEQFIPDENLRNISLKFKNKSDDNLSSIMFGGRSDLKFNERFLKKYPDSAQKRLEQIQRKRPQVKVLGVNEEYELKSSTFDSLDYVFLENKPSNESNYWKILGLYNNKRTYRWLPKKYMDARYPNKNNLDKYKVFVPKANGSGILGEVLSTPLVGTPFMSATPTFISIGAFESKYEAEATLKYIKTKLARLLLGILKITQDNPPSKWSYIPLQDFTAKSDIDWSQSVANIDQQLYKKYELTKDEIDFIETKVKSMD